MHMRSWFSFFAPLVFCGAFFGTAVLLADDRADIEQAIRTYVEAFNQRDATTMAAGWHPQGVYISRTSGEQIVGRDKLEEEFTAAFEGNQNAKLEVTTDSIEFVSPNVAVENGSATVSGVDEQPIHTTYSAIFVRYDGKWLIDRITEEEVPLRPSNYEKLKDLEWLIGQWIDDTGLEIVLTDFSWTRDYNFINCSYSVFMDGEVDSSGLQLIGWDAARNQIRTWIFDTSGAFGEGTWEKKGDRWFVQISGTFPDGSSGSHVAVYRQIDDDSFGWQKINRLVGGELLPHVDEVVVVRQQPAHDVGAQ